ncbi:MAG: diaminopimelate decarboxylase, partial [Candidatus Pacearchaeota archaeon]
MVEQIRKYNFEYKQNILNWYGINLKDISEEFGTPLFVFSLDEFIKRIRRFKENVGYGHILCFSVKSNNNPHLIASLKNEGYGVDVVSGGELFLARKVGIAPKNIV